MRLQLQTLVSSTSTSSDAPLSLPAKYRGPFQTVLTIVQEEGMRAPFKVSSLVHRPRAFARLSAALECTALTSSLLT